MSVVIKMTWQMNLTGRANPSLIGTACATSWRRHWHLPLTEFVLHNLCCFMWGVCYLPCAILCGEYVLHTLGYFMWKMCLTYPIAFCVRSMSYTRSAILCGEFLFHAGSFLNAPCCFKWGASLTHPILFYVWIFSDTPRCFKWGVSFLIVCPVFFRVNSFFYTPQAVLCRSFLLQFYVPGTSLSGEFLLHTPC